jgi:hypothetical protein
MNAIHPTAWPRVKASGRAVGDIEMIPLSKR